MTSDALRALTIGAHGIAIWGLCGGVMEGARAAIGQDGALVVHAIAAPLIAAAVTASYRRWFGYARPAPTAVAFTAVPMLLDAAVIAPFAEHSYAMFASPVGTWIPFALIFASSYLTGTLVSRPRRAPGAERA